VRVFDLPPTWLVAALVATWSSPWIFPWGGLFATGAILFVVAGLITLAALYEFLRARTTFVPRREPSALITSGVFGITRNPIYLADAFILMALTLMWGRILGILLAVLFLWQMERRFVLDEEARLRAKFGEAYETYERQTRRWL